MKSKIIVLGDSPLVTGFCLAGVNDHVMCDQNTFQKSLESILENKDYGIIIVNQSMLECIDWKLKKRLDTLAYPVVVPMQSAANKEKEESQEIRNLVKRALGFDISKK